MGCTRSPSGLSAANAGGSESCAGGFASCACDGITGNSEVAAAERKKPRRENEESIVMAYEDATRVAERQELLATAGSERQATRLTRDVLLRRIRWWLRLLRLRLLRLLRFW